MGDAPRVIVVGGGLAGLMTTIRLAETGMPVDLFSVVPVKRSHSVCAQGGINAAVTWKGEGDSPARHFDDTVYGGDFLANQPPVRAMCEAGPGIIFLLDRMGVPFNRTPEGLLDFRRFGGTLFNRTAFAGATTGQQLLYALDEQVRRFEAGGLVRKHEMWELCSLVMDDAGRCRGITALDLRRMEVHPFPARAVNRGRRRGTRSVRRGAVQHLAGLGSGLKEGTGCKFSSVSKLLAVAMAQGERCIRAWCSEKNAYDSGQA